MAGLTKVLRSVAELAQLARANVTPHHFYSDIPDFRELRRSDHWRTPFSMHGVQGAEIEPQSEFVESCTAPFRDQVAGVHQRASDANGETGYGPIEAQFLYCFIRSRKPRRIVQIGCGVTTAIILEAASAEAGYAPEVLCIEPFPTAMLRRFAAHGRITLDARPAQHVDAARLADLAPGDLLFVDSTHTVRVGSEVVKVINEVLPRLPAGARAHFHDIYFPYDFSPSILQDDVFFWRETTLLYALLVHNPRLTIEASLSMIHHAAPESLRHSLPEYRPAVMRQGLFVQPGHYPSSIFLRVCA